MMSIRKPWKINLSSLIVAKLCPVVLRICLADVGEENFFLDTKISGRLSSFCCIQCVVSQIVMNIFLQNWWAVYGINMRYQSWRDLAVPVCYDSSTHRLEYVHQGLGCLVKLEKNLVWLVAKYDEFFLEWKSATEILGCPLGRDRLAAFSYWLTFEVMVWPHVDSAVNDPT